MLLFMLFPGFQAEADKLQQIFLLWFHLFKQRNLLLLSPIGSFFFALLGFDDAIAKACVRSGELSLCHLNSIHIERLQQSESSCL